MSKPVDPRWFIDPASAERARGVIAAMGQLVAFATLEDVEAEAQRCMEVADVLNAAWDRVKGNRADTAPMSVGDLKLVTTAVLKALVEELEK